MTTLLALLKSLPQILALVSEALKALKWLVKKFETSTPEFIAESAETMKKVNNAETREDKRAALKAIRDLHRKLG